MNDKFILSLNVINTRPHAHLNLPSYSFVVFGFLDPEVFFSYVFTSFDYGSMCEIIFKLGFWGFLKGVTSRVNSLKNKIILRQKEFIGSKGFLLIV